MGELVSDDEAQGVDALGSQPGDREGVASFYGQVIYPVRTPSGGDLNLQSQAEAEWYEGRAELYQTQNRLTNVSDLLDLDRLLQHEVMVYRWGQWSSQGFDYDGTLVDQGAMQRQVREYSREIRELKLALKIDKISRDKERGESLADYTTRLLERAKEFGVHRNNQYAEAVNLMYEIRTQVMLYDRCDEEERRELGLSPESIIEWIRKDVVARWDEIDEAFRGNQKIWVRELR